MYKHNIGPMASQRSNKYYTFWVCACNLRYPAC